MQKNNYSFLTKWMHQIYLGNYFVSKTSFEIEQTIFKKEINFFKINEIVFVTGLARAGTTALFNAIYDTNSYASLKYSNMPFLLMPLLWSHIANNKKATELAERAHNDGIQVNSESPEEFDEYYWKTMLNDNYITKNNLITHPINDKTLKDFESYIKAPITG